MGETTSCNSYTISEDECKPRNWYPKTVTLHHRSGEPGREREGPAGHVVRQPWWRWGIVSQVPLVTSGKKKCYILENEQKMGYYQKWRIVRWGYNLPSLGSLEVSSLFLTSRATVTIALKGKVWRIISSSIAKPTSSSRPSLLSTMTSTISITSGGNKGREDRLSWRYRLEDPEYKKERIP